VHDEPVATLDKVHDAVHVPGLLQLYVLHSGAVPQFAVDVHAADWQDPVVPELQQI